MRQPRWLKLMLAACLCLFTTAWAVDLQPQGQIAAGLAAEPALPPPQIHPLPPTLAAWQATGQGDYFDAVTPTSVGYLVWSTFPIRVYIQPVDAADSTGRSQAWYEAVSQAVQEWTTYLPLVTTDAADQSDITILRLAPAIRLAPATAPNQALIDRLPRVRAAETRYELFLQRHQSASEPLSTTLIHRFTIQLTPNQAADYTKATARHELGHALGIWGHSPLPTDTMYFSQVRNPATISQRDINTLKRIYQQPTRLGWMFPKSNSAAGVYSVQTSVGWKQLHIKNIENNGAPA
jgi:predicted Zn-dependent protease